MEIPRDRKPDWLEEQNRIDSAAASRIPDHLRVFKDNNKRTINNSRVNEELNSTHSDCHMRHAHTIQDILDRRGLLQIFMQCKFESFDTEFYGGQGITCIHPASGSLGKSYGTRSQLPSQLEAFNQMIASDSYREFTSQTSATPSESY